MYFPLLLYAPQLDGAAAAVVYLVDDDGVNHLPLASSTKNALAKQKLLDVAQAVAKVDENFEMNSRGRLHYSLPHGELSQSGQPPYQYKKMFVYEESEKGS